MKSETLSLSRLFIDFYFPLISLFMIRKESKTEHNQINVIISDIDTAKLYTQ